MWVHHDTERLEVWVSKLWFSLVDSFCILHFVTLFHLSRGAGSIVLREGFDSSVIMPFSWCVVAVTLRIWCRSKFSANVSQEFMTGSASQAGDADYSRAPGFTSGLQGIRECPPWCSIVSATVTVHQFFCILHFCHTCSLCLVKLVVQFPTRGSTQVLLCLFHGVLWLWHFLYSVGLHPVSNLHIYTFVVSRAFMVGAARQAEDSDSSRAPGLTSGLQGSVIVHCDALLLVPQWQCISSFVFYI